MKPTAAVIMRSLNERPHMDKALKKLFDQSYGLFELYNVDSGSGDGSYEIAKKWNPERTFQIPPKAYIPGKVLNEMIAKTKNEIIVLLNADAIPQGKDWMEKLIAPILNGEADATWSRQIARPDAEFIVRYDYERAFDPKNIAKNPYFFSAVACAFRKKMWEETSFYTDGYSEDLIWRKICQQKGCRFQYVSESVVEHSHNYTLKQLYRRKWIEGAAERIIFTAKPSIINQSYLCLREISRDLIYTLLKGKPHLIPYNLAYRIVAHKGFYYGKVHG